MLLGGTRPDAIVSLLPLGSNVFPLLLGYMVGKVPSYVLNGFVAALPMELQLHSAGVNEERDM